MQDQVLKRLKYFQKNQLFSHAYCEMGYVWDDIPALSASIYPDERRTFDLASLSKLFATSVLIADLIIKRRADRDTTLVDLFDRSLLNDFPDWIGRLKVYEILSHTSGLPGWRNFYTSCVVNHRLSQDRIINVFCRLSDSDKVSGEVYSDLGFILLGKLLTGFYEKDLSQLFEEWKKHNGIKSSIGFEPKRLPIPTIPTGFCGLRNRMVENEVHDENAAFMGEFCGHTGLFSTGEDLGTFVKDFFATKEAQFLVRESYNFKLQFSSPHPIGFRLANDPGSSDFFGNKSIGHYGFTGTSFWYNPEKECYVLLLTNRNLYQRIDSRIKIIRAELSKIAYELFR